MAQNISMEETLAYINAKLDGKYSFDVKRGLLLVSSYKDGMKMMDEKILITDLNPEVEFFENEKALIIKCAGGEKCVEREEYFVKKKNYFTRINIATPEGEKSVKGLQNAFLHIIKLVQFPKYMNDAPFE